jgi:hypothetical protein
LSKEWVKMAAEKMENEEKSKKCGIKWLYLVERMQK